MGEHTGPGQRANDGKDAAQQRGEYVAALKVEREGYVRAGKSDRVAAVDAELERFEEKPKGRRAVKGDEA